MGKMTGVFYWVIELHNSGSSLPVRSPSNSWRLKKKTKTKTKIIMAAAAGLYVDEEDGADEDGAEDEGGESTDPLARLPGTR